MAYPSGSGSERLAYVADVMSATTSDDMLVASADTIVTVKSIILCEMGGVAEGITLKVNDGSDIILCPGQALAAYDTFVWNDVFVFGKTGGTSTLKLATDSSATIHWYVSYIVQDWST